MQPAAPRMEDCTVSDIETQEEKSKRTRAGQMAIILSLAWWVVSIGGIIYVINAQS